MRNPKLPFGDAFYTQKSAARRRGILFLLSYAEWWQIWDESGHWHERGRRSEQYVMARFGDTGPYSKDNVKIITCAENAAESNKGKTRSAETRAKMSAFQKERFKDPKVRERQAEFGRGRTHTLETRAKISASQRERLKDPEAHVRLSESHKGLTQSLETRAKRSAKLKGRPGKPHSAEARAKMSAARKAWHRRKAQAEIDT